MDRDIAEHAEIGNRQNRNLGIDHGRRDIPGALPQFGVVEYRDHHVAPGKVRCIDCSSLSSWPRYSLWRPKRPPCCIQWLVGNASVASLTTDEIVLSQCGRKLAGSTAMPASISARSLPSTSNISPVKGQRAP